MLQQKPRYSLFAGVGFLALATASIAYAAGLRAPADAADPSAAAESSPADTDIEFQSDRMDAWDDGVMVYSGDVQLRVPASASIEFRADRVSGESGAQLLEGAVRFDIGLAQISTERAIVERASNGDTLIRMDQAEVRRGQ